tara:strand:+ start:279 stop:872 length:594 start_codon:yes stop_codon:yes gene_type:complete
MKSNRLILFTFLLLANLGVRAQTNYTLSSETAEMIVDGSSTVSDWSVSIRKAKGNFLIIDNFKIEIGASLYSNLKFEFLVDEMESGRGPIMNNKVKKALKSSEHPMVNYNSTENKIVSVKDKSFVLESKGEIEIGGLKKPFSFLLNCSYNEEMKTISFEGNKDITMSMFNIVRPTAFFGKLKTMDGLNVKFNMSFTK